MLGPAAAFHLSPCSRLTALHSMADVADATVMERTVYLDLGGFDPAYKEGYWEDMDLAVRMGGRVRWVGPDGHVRVMFLGHALFLHTDVTIHA